MSRSSGLFRLIFALLLAFAAAVPAPAQEVEEIPLAPELVQGGKVYLVNDLQAWGESMLVFRKFRREFRRLERYEEVGSRDEADLVFILSGDPDVADNYGLINHGIPYPTGYMTSKIMQLLVVGAKNNFLYWYDGVDWVTRESTVQMESYEKLVKRLKERLDKAEG